MIVVVPLDLASQAFQHSEVGEVAHHAAFQPSAGSVDRHENVVAMIEVGPGGAAETALLVLGVA